MNPSRVNEPGPPAYGLNFKLPSLRMATGYGTRRGTRVVVQFGFVIPGILGRTCAGDRLSKYGEASKIPSGSPAGVPTTTSQPQSRCGVRLARRLGEGSTTRVTRGSYVESPQRRAHRRPQSHQVRRRKSALIDTKRTKEVDLRVVEGSFEDPGRVNDVRGGLVKFQRPRTPLRCRKPCRIVW